MINFPHEDFPEDFPENFQHNHSFTGNAIALTPFSSQNYICGFLVSGRWPVNTLEWLHTLIVAVKMASFPGLLPSTTIFSVREDIPENAAADTIGLLIAEYAFHTTAPAEIPILHHQPPALFVLHPPEETTPSLPEYSNTASGCMLLPGLPHLGLEHRAGWAEARHDVLISMRSQAGIDPQHDPDTAILAMLLSA